MIIERRMEKQDLIRALNKKTVRLKRQKNKLKERISQLKQVTDRCKNEEMIPDTFYGNADDYRRLILNNDRMGLKTMFCDEDASYLTFNALQFYAISPSDTYGIISRLSGLGDELCQLLMKGYNDHEHRNKFWEGIDPESIAVQMVTRKGLTAESYQGYVDILTERTKTMAPNNFKMTAGLG